MVDVPPDRFVGTEPDPVQAGTQLNVHFELPSAAGTTVTVQATNGTETRDINIPLDSSGKGIAPFEVPATGWAVVTLKHPESHNHSVPVLD